MSDVSSTAPVSSPSPEASLSTSPEATSQQAAPESTGEQITPAEQKQMEQILKEKFKVKVHGKEKEVELDWNNKEEIQRRLQLSEAAQLAMQERAELNKFLSEQRKILESNPLKFLEEQGYDVTDLMEKHLEKVVKEMEMSPEERKRIEMETEIEQLRTKIRNEEKRREEAELRSQQEAAQTAIQNEISAALSANTSLPKSPTTVRKMADLMLIADDNGIELSPAQAAQLLEKEMLSDAMELLKGFDPEKLESFLGEENNKKLKGLRAKRAKPVSSPISELKPTGAESKSQQNSSAQKVRAKDFFKGLGRK